MAPTTHYAAIDTGTTTGTVYATGATRGDIATSLGEALGQGQSGCAKHDHPEPPSRCPRCVAQAEGR